MIKSVKNINYHNDLYMDLFLPEQEEFFTIVHFHGGGLVEGDKGDTHQYVEHLAKCGLQWPPQTILYYQITNFQRCLMMPLRLSSL